MIATPKGPPCRLCFLCSWVPLPEAQGPKGLLWVMSLVPVPGPWSRSLVPGPWSRSLVPGPGPWSLVPVPWSRSLVPVPGPWSPVPGPWSLVPGPGPWSLVPGPWSLVPGPCACSWCLNPVAYPWSLAPGPWSLVLVTGLPVGLCGCPWGAPGACLLYTSPSPRDATLSRMPSSA